MSDLMRKEFEQAVVNMHVSHGVTPEDAAAFLETGSNGYRSVSTKSAWWSWQASRECLVVELPEPRVARGYGEQVADALGFNDGINYCEEAIHAAGVKTK